MLLDEKDDDVDLGINPKEIYSSKNLLGKGFIHRNDPITLSIMLAIQECDYERGDIIDDFVKLYIQLTGSVGGRKIDKYIDGAKARVGVNDMQISKNVEGE